MHSQDMTNTKNLLAGIDKARCEPVLVLRDAFGLSVFDLPVGLQEGAARWFLFGLWPGSFLSAVIRDELINSFRHADDFNRTKMFQIVAWFHQHAPLRAIGRNAPSWHKSGGLAGMAAKDAADTMERAIIGLENTDRLGPDGRKRLDDLIRERAEFLSAVRDRNVTIASDEAAA